MFVQQDVPKTESMKTPLRAELIYNNADTWILKLTGSVDLTNRSLLWTIDNSDLFKKVMATSTKKLVIDLTATKRLDSRGLRHLFDIHKLFTLNNIQVVLKNPNVHLQHLFRIMQFNQIFMIEFDGDQNIPMQ